jgi:hypothetical protein
VNSFDIRDFIGFLSFHNSNRLFSLFETRKKTRLPLLLIELAGSRFGEFTTRASRTRPRRATWERCCPSILLQPPPPGSHCAGQRVSPRPPRPRPPHQSSTGQASTAARASCRDSAGCTHGASLASCCGASTGQASRARCGDGTSCTRGASPVSCSAG